MIGVSDIKAMVLGLMIILAIVVSKFEDGQDERVSPHLATADRAGLHQVLG
ncbi:hypothetical protein [Ruegeria sp. ANG-R]|uniref:hypothetical protein n=1 Tax=Ruegeria sp. ANG-R TaxID=1577903 RepID=UPI000B1023F5|nr:hypothetical protein [Ruegeria sp. ANG-R]